MLCSTSKKAAVCFTTISNVAVSTHVSVNNVSNLAITAHASANNVRVDLFLKKSFITEQQIQLAWGLEKVNLKLIPNYHASWIWCSVIKIPFRKRSTLTLFTDTYVVTARLLIMVKHTANFLLELQSTWVFLI